MKIVYIIVIFIGLGFLYTLADSIERFETSVDHPENKSMKKEDLIDTYTRDDNKNISNNDKKDNSADNVKMTCDYNDYVHKTNLPDMSKYILKTQMPVCPTIPDMDKYVLKSSIPPCHMENSMNETKPISFPVETIGVDPLELI